MEYLGSFLKRKVDRKRRVVFPSPWLAEEMHFVAVHDGHLRIYPSSRWKEVMENLHTDEEQISWSKKSIIMKLDSLHRLVLPNDVKWNAVRFVNFVGMIDHFIIQESEA